MPLKRIPRSISPQLLFILSKMGHGDELLLADANFPSYGQKVSNIVHAENCSATKLLEDILAVFPLDSFAKFQASVMKQVDSELDAPIIANFQDILTHCYRNDGSGNSPVIERLERFQFYERAKSVFAICVTGKL